MVHLSFVEWIRLLSGAPVSISIPSFRAIIRIVPSLSALIASNLTQVSLGGCGWIGAILIVISSVPISILTTIVIMRPSSSVVVTSMVMNKPSRIRG